jgi:hypothetical protein
MKVFISWSGERSRLVAEALRDWLPDVIQAVEPFMSQQDIPKGIRWGLEIARELEGTSVGIVCLTPDNLTAPWILFEAGSLSKTVAHSRLCTYLLDLEPTHLSSPLADFQATKADRDDSFQMLLSINSALGPAGLPHEKLKRAFERWWQTLEDRLKAIPPAEHPVEPPKQEDMLAEILRYVRASGGQPSVAPRVPPWLTDADTQIFERRQQLMRLVAEQKALDELAAQTGDQSELASIVNRQKIARITEELDELEPYRKRGAARCAVPWDNRANRPAL